MRRSGLLRKTPLRKRRPGKQRRGRVYDPAYMSWVRQFPCASCGLEGGSDPCHTSVLGHRGYGQKSSDRSCIPLCRKCHDIFDAGRDRKEFRSRLDVARIVEYLNRVYSDFKS